MSKGQAPSAPGAWEWIGGFMGTLLFGYQSTLLQSAARPHSGFRYYVEEHHTLWIHQFALVLNASIVLLALSGFYARAWLPQLRLGMRSAMGLGVFLIGFELVNLSRMPATATYAFGQLPYIPVNNLGLLGSQLYLTMLLAALPLRGVPALQAFGIKAALAIGLFLAQNMVWEMFLA